MTTLSYNLNIDVSESTGTNPSAYTQVSNSLVIQSNNNTITNCKSAKLPYTLGVNQVKSILLTDLGLKYLKIVSVKSNNIVRLAQGNRITEGSNIFIENKIPATIPTTVSTDTLTLTNISNEIVNVEIILVFLV
jgi:hypothetical protein